MSPQEQRAVARERDGWSETLENAACHGPGRDGCYGCTGDGYDPDEGRPEAPSPRPLRASLAALALTLAVMVSGCGASALRTHYDALAVVGQVYDAATDGAEAALNTQAAACNGDDACLDGVAASWYPVQAAQGGALLALQGWASSLALWEAAGDFPAFMRAAVRALDALGTAWNGWATAAQGVGWTLPQIPPDLLTIARAVGGE